MNLFLSFRAQLQSLGSSLVGELDSLIARIRGSWNVEHLDDDTHGNVHALSVATGRLTYSDIASVTLAVSPANNLTPGGLSTAALLRLNSSSLSIVSITGIQSPQDETGMILDGRVLVLENISTACVFVLEAEHTASAPSNRIITPWGPPATTADPLRLYIRPSSLITLIYNAAKARWMVVGQANDNSVQDTSLTAATQYNDLSTSAIGRARICRVTSAGAGASISGFSATNIPTSTRLTIVNTGLYKFSILHQNTGSLSTNRVQCPGGIRYILNPREAVDLYKTDDGWRIIEKADQWLDVTYAAGNYTASAGTWTVEAADQVTLAYQIDGDNMTVAFELDNTSVSSTPTTLKIAIPNGRTAARRMSEPLASAVDNGTAIDTGRAQVSAGGTTIDIFKNAAGSAWAAATNATSVRGKITFKVLDDTATISENHTDVAHADTTHADVAHSDVSHSDVVHGDSHSDASHTDVSHSDIAHVDSSSHSDVAHEDVAHTDSSSHSDVAHADGHDDVAHDDFHGDDPIGPPHADEHFDTPHSDSHSDVTHSDSTTHSDVAHDDVAHTDSTAHTDTAHSDVTHVDGGHADSHSDTVPHSDTAHVDVSHADTAHADAVHADVGYHTDSTHADV